jgi:alkanesulfonate monooxygenase SsuD/methylene tetrahydromethanopterin reductase-like flavin-dependent oxidoreductase (luciferase family)
MGVFPKPARGTIPVWIGGHTPAALRRAAELGDGWHAAFPTPAELEKGLGRLRDACAKVGRDPATLTVSARMGLSARRPADEVLGELKTLAGLGVAHVVLETRARDLDEMTGLYETFAAQIRGRVS